jgi:hypothetical protein
MNCGSTDGKHSKECIAEHTATLAQGFFGKWMPIESAPKDGTDVHVTSSKWLMPVPAHFTSKGYLQKEYGDQDCMEEGWYPSCGFLFDLPEVTIDPTHWMPLPPPPSPNQ